MPDIHRWQQQYLGTSVFPKTVSVVELQAFFTFSERELEALKQRFRRQNRVAAAVQLGFLKMAGNHLTSVEVIPKKLLRHIAAQFGQPALSIASLRAMYKRPKTLYEHQWWAAETLNFSKANELQLRPLHEALCSEAAYVASVEMLVERAKSWLYQHRYLSIADRVMRDIARSAMASSEAALFAMIVRQLPASRLHRIEATLFAPHPGTSRSSLEWLQQPPRKKSINALRERLERVEFIKALGIQAIDMDGIPIEKIRAYGSELRHTHLAIYKELKNPTRTLRLICNLKLVLMQATDAAILLGGRLTANVVRAAYEKARAVEAEGALSLAQAYEQIAARVDDPTISADEFREYVRTLVHHQRPRQFATRAAAARWLLSEPNPQIRALLNEMQKLDVDAEPHDPSKDRLHYLKGLYRNRLNVLPQQHGIDTPATWRDIIEGEDRERAMRGLEAATLIGLRKSLRSGSVFVDHSEKFRGRHLLLIGDEQWQKDRSLRYEQLGLTQPPDHFLDALLSELEHKLAELGKAVTHGQLRIVGPNLHVPHDKTRDIAPEVGKYKDVLGERVGVVQLPDLILEMDSRVGFSKLLLGRTARTSNELLQVYAGMLAHGTAMDAAAVSLMVPQLTANQILAGMNHFEDRAVVRSANDAVVGYQKRLTIASHWGDGTLASADMMSLDVSRKVWVARLDPKRGIPSVGTYTHTSDFWSVIYDQPIVLNERQAGAAIEGAIRQKEVEIDRLAVDTHGYTEFAMAIAKLLGFALCPRLKRINERRFHVPTGMRDIPESLQDVVIPSISLRRIREEWDDLVRLTASIETGHTTATVALARFGSASSDSPIYRAGVHLGRLVRSIYLCDYFLSEDLRRTVNRILVHGEAVHTLQRAINAGSFSKPRGRREDELYAVSGSLTLLTNLCLAWTASRMQDVVFGEGGMAAEIEDLSWLSHVGPARYGNINFRGTFSFDVGPYQQWLLDEPARTASRQGR